MAFIRWRLNSAGNRQAYLVHSYRDAEGKPRHKVLAYLGDKDELTPEHLAALQQKHSDRKINWEKIKPAPRPTTDISTLSDAELLRKMRALRHERGLSPHQMAWRLQDHGIPEFTGTSEDHEMKGRHFHHGRIGALEKAMENGQGEEYYMDPERELAPVLRKVFSALK